MPTRIRYIKQIYFRRSAFWNFYVIKLKHIIIALLIFAVIPIIWFTTSRAVSVFNVNGREIPIYSVERCDNKIALTFDCAWNDDDIDSILVRWTSIIAMADIFRCG